MDKVIACDLKIQSHTVSGVMSQPGMMQPGMHPGGPSFGGHPGAPQFGNFPPNHPGMMGQANNFR